MSETPTDLIEQFLIENTKLGRCNFYASEIVTTVLADYEIVPRSQYEALMRATEVLRLSVNSHMLHFKQAREALAALRSAGIEGEGK